MIVRRRSISGLVLAMPSAEKFAEQTYQDSAYLYLSTIPPAIRDAPRNRRAIRLVLIALPASFPRP
jgi:hypothetical protein